LRGFFSVSARDPKQTSSYNALGDDQRAGVRGAFLRLELETHDFDLPAVRNSSLCRTCFAYLDCVGIFLQKSPLVSIRMGLYCRYWHRSIASHFVPVKRTSRRLVGLSPHDQ
jgi:hypothetical protein